MTELVSPLFAVLRVSGADAREFLQGQLTCDLRELTPQHALLGACNSPQGRVQAVMTLIERSDGIAILIPASMFDLMLTRLRKYVLRSKVILTDERQRLRASLFGSQAITQLGLRAPLSTRTHHEVNNRGILRWHDSIDERYIVLSTDDSMDGIDELSSNDWQLADIRAGLPQIYPETYEAFTAQMLNLDLLGGISFEKGCYTGQEIIARTHYRGTVKRRMLHFSANCLPPAPGTRLLANEEHAGDVITAATTCDTCELLAVMNLAAADATINIENKTAATLQRLPLPYAV